MTEESLERYGGILAAPARHRWRRVVATVGAIHAIAALAAVAVFFVHHGAASPRCRTLIPPGGPWAVWTVVLSQRGQELATVGYGGTYLWDVATGRRVATLTGPASSGGAYSVAFSRDGRTLAAGSEGGKVFLCTVR